MARNRFSSPETDARANTRRTVMDGPFAETKELIAGSFWPDPGKADDFDSEFTPDPSEQEESVRR